MSRNQLCLPVIMDSLSLEHLSSLVFENFSLTVKSIVQLNGYDDKNYYIQVTPETRNPHISKICEDGYVLKIMNPLDSENTDLVIAQHEMMKYLDRKGIRVPSPVKNLKGDTYFLEKFNGNKGHVVRLLTYQPGNILKSVPTTSQLFYNVGKFVGSLSNVLQDFVHPSYDTKKSIWMLERVLDIRPMLLVVKDEGKLKVVQGILQEFEDTVLSNFDKLRKGTIHGDVNEHNIIVSNGDVEALLDFGDSHRSAIMFELAICMCYMMLVSSVTEGFHIIKGYLEMRTLEPLEREFLKVSICARLSQSLVLGLYTYSQDPNNEYILSSQENGWNLLQKLVKLSRQEIFTLWGLEDEIVKTLNIYTEELQQSTSYVAERTSNEYIQLREGMLLLHSINTVIRTTMGVPLLFMFLHECIND